MGMIVMNEKMETDKIKMDEIKTIEEVMLNALPSLNTLYYDEWRLRFAGGYTNRANSVNVIAPSTIPLEEKICHCEKIYTAQRLPTVFKISPLSLELDDLLEQAGYELVTKTNIMTMDLRESYGKNHCTGYFSSACQRCCYLFYQQGLSAPGRKKAFKGF